MKRISVLVMLTVTLSLGTATIANSASQTYFGTGSPNSTAAGSVTVSATVGPKINMTIIAPDATQTVNFGAVSPGAGSVTKTVTLSVDSNRTFAVTKSVSGQAAQLGLVTTLASGTGGAEGVDTTFSDDYTIQPPWNTDPGVYNAVVQYTVTQS